MSVDTRNSEIENLIESGVENIIDYFAPYLDDEPGAYSSDPFIKGKTIKGKLIQKFRDEIFNNIDKQLDSLSKDIDEAIENAECEKEAMMDKIHGEVVSELETTIESLKERIAELEEENRLFQDGRHGKVYSNRIGL